jgi:hypothetical protein
MATQSEPAKGGYAAGGLSNTKVPMMSEKANLVTSRLNAGGDTKFKGNRGSSGNTSKGKGMNKNAYKNAYK